MMKEDFNPNIMNNIDNDNNDKEQQKLEEQVRELQKQVELQFQQLPPLQSNSNQNSPPVETLSLEEQNRIQQEQLNTLNALVQQQLSELQQPELNFSFLQEHVRYILKNIIAGGENGPFVQANLNAPFIKFLNSILEAKNLGDLKRKLNITTEVGDDDSFCLGLNQDLEKIGFDLMNYFQQQSMLPQTDEEKLNLLKTKALFLKQKKGDHAEASKFFNLDEIINANDFNIPALATIKNIIEEEERSGKEKESGVAPNNDRVFAFVDEVLSAEIQEIEEENENYFNKVRQAENECEKENFTEVADCLKKVPLKVVDNLADKKNNEGLTHFWLVVIKIISNILETFGISALLNKCLDSLKNNKNTIESELVGLPQNTKISKAIKFIPKVIKEQLNQASQANQELETKIAKRRNDLLFDQQADKNSKIVQEYLKRKKKEQNSNTAPKNINKETPTTSPKNRKEIKITDQKPMKHMKDIKSVDLQQQILEQKNKLKKVNRQSLLS